MTEQSYFSLFTLIIGFVPVSIKRLHCDFDYNGYVFSKKLVLSRDYFSNYLKQYDEKTLFLQTANCIIKIHIVNIIKG